MIKQQHYFPCKKKMPTKIETPSVEMKNFVMNICLCAHVVQGKQDAKERETRNKSMNSQRAFKNLVF